jgi:hypothetical protein
MNVLISMLKRGVAYLKNPETKQEISDLWAAGNTEELNRRLRYTSV